jgi:putative transposase
MVSPSTKRRAVKVVVEEGVGTTAEACRALGLARSSYYRNSTVSLESRQMHGQIVQLSQHHPRYGYRRVTAVLRREGHEINAKRVQRVRRKEGLQVSRSCVDWAFRRQSGSEHCAPITSGAGILWRTRRRTERDFAC